MSPAAFEHLHSIQSPAVALSSVLRSRRLLGSVPPSDDPSHKTKSNSRVSPEVSLEVSLEVSPKVSPFFYRDSEPFFALFSWCLMGGGAACLPPVARYRLVILESTYSRRDLPWPALHIRKAALLAKRAPSSRTLHGRHRATTAARLTEATTGSMAGRHDT